MYRNMPHGGKVEITRIVAELDKEIARLKEARALLAGSNTSGAKIRKAPAIAKKSRGRMSAEGRHRIAEAMKKRWAERRKQQSGKGK
jgi:hypothetical protein